MRTGCFSESIESDRCGSSVLAPSQPALDLDDISYRGLFERSVGDQTPITKNSITTNQITPRTIFKIAKVSLFFNRSPATWV